MTDTELMEEQMKTGQEESRAKKAAARAQMLADQAKRQQTDMLFRAAIAKSKLQREKDLEEERVAQAAMKARAAGMAEEAAKRKNEKSSRHYFPQSPFDRKAQSTRRRPRLSRRNTRMMTPSVL
jgi:uncharacterized membrane protein YgaE (UPF0421/DUF939 family)